jgi:hypothetical protein
MKRGATHEKNLLHLELHLPDQKVFDCYCFFPIVSGSWNYPSPDYFVLIQHDFIPVHLLRILFSHKLVVPKSHRYLHPTARINLVAVQKSPTFQLRPFYWANRNPYRHQS